ncbi:MULTISPECIES: GntR family transcriptional regulator [Cupriavidus]|uniref:GntR family transcriptional regulator n=1 Tax=Cupriavidus gilardii TaxID=82541 RepID=A0A6N1BH16_9BURK|nr:MULTISPECIES: GntR family transcriptional regulator [Cupriavidus]KAB0595600.1 GntR family transcriptional regulator [Cupriavidus gilardii]MCD9119488.1 GntR family transcriptional regulator [Cupriavidus sp. UGS-1]MCT9013498.1 GntR family transcriptional regulator [Cupriavidus gilardii]MCT9016419.1 GntR family transcriptional regulator [Cupriavidus gilardii]MCT9056189.1 GntR family transcriptional regulator [Cupriavidus gilardii]
MSRRTASEITRELLDGIKGGRYPVGALLPTEFELCEQFHASRYTIRAVLQELQDLGLVSRRKNVGTRVEAAEPKAVFKPTLASVEDLMQFGEQHRRVVQAVETTVAPAEVAAALGGTPATKWLRISSVRWNDDAAATPIAWTDIYIDTAYEDIGAIVRDTPDVLVSSLIESRHGRQIAEIEQSVRASTLTDKRVARALGIEIGSSVLKVVRRYLDEAGDTFEVSVTIHPAETFSVTTRMRRSTR